MIYICLSQVTGHLTMKAGGIWNKLEKTNFYLAPTGRGWLKIQSGVADKEEAKQRESKESGRQKQSPGRAG